MNKLKLYNINENLLTFNLKQNLKLNFNNYDDEYKNIDKSISNQMIDCINLYVSDNCIEHYYYFYEHYIKNEFPSMEDKIGIDYGCWFGISSLVYSLFQNKKIYALDFYEKDTINNFLNKFDKDNIIEYYNLKDLSKIKKVDWIIIYDVLDSYVTDENIITNFSNKIEILRNMLNDGGILVITDFESTSKIKLLDLDNIISKYFMNYKIYYNNDNSRFIISCYRNNTNNCLINISSFSYTGTSYISRILSQSIDANFLSTYLNCLDDKSNIELPNCYNCEGVCNFKNIIINPYINSHCILNNIYNTTTYNKLFNRSIKIYLSRYIYSMIYTSINRVKYTFDKSLLFWIKACANNIPECDYYTSYENFTDNYKQEIINLCTKFNIKFNFNFYSKRCNIFNHANESEIFYSIYKNNKKLDEKIFDLTSFNNMVVNTSNIINTIKYHKYKYLFEQEDNGIINSIDSYKNKLSLSNMELIYNTLSNMKNIDPLYYKYNIIVSPEKCFEKYFLFNPIECCFKKTNIYNKELDNYSVLIEESNKLSNHYIERTFYNIKNNVDFDIEFLIKCNFIEYQIISHYTDKSGNYKSNILNLNTFDIYKDGFRKINLTLNSNTGNNEFNLKLIFLYNGKQNYIGNKNRYIEFIIQ